MPWLSCLRPVFAAAYFWSSYLDILLFMAAMVVALSLKMANLCPGSEGRACGPTR
jgi:hypothetical protein